MSKINDGGPAFPRPASEFTKSGTCPDGNGESQYDTQRSRIHLLTLTVTRLRYHGGSIDDALADEIESVL